MRDGYGQQGAGTSDMRQASDDLQHGVQKRTAVENPQGYIRHIRQQVGGGGPIKEALEEELKRHEHSRTLRLSHLHDSIKR